MSKEERILQALEDMSITFDEMGFSPTIPVFKGHQDFNYLFSAAINEIKTIAKEQDQKIAELEKKLEEQPKQIIEKIIEEYNLNRKPIIDNFGNVAFGYATINADKLKEFLDNLLKEYSNE